MISSTQHSEMYAVLAELLAEPPDWMSLPGSEWPLFELASDLLPFSTALHGLKNIQRESSEDRCKRYKALLSTRQNEPDGTGNPQFWLYESAFLTGRILGAATFEVAKLYSQAGLDVQGSELPDGASQELSFLAHLTVVDPAAENEFIKEHAGKWLPALGHLLSRGKDPVYAVIGQVLMEFLLWKMAPAPRLRKNESAAIGKIPVMQNLSACNLCGFCVQLCPTQALFISENPVDTMLVFKESACTGCGKCVRVCDTSALIMAASENQLPGKLPGPSSDKVLVRSERITCKQCGQPMVSLAEMNFVIEKIGHPGWLDFCSECRLPALQ